MGCVLGVALCSTASADPSDVLRSELRPVSTVGQPGELADRPVEPEPEVPGHTPMIERPEALAPFFAALARTEAGVGITRVTQLGDSSVGMDAIPSGMRSRFQARFGDGGPGFVLLQPPNESYASRSVGVHATPPWASCVAMRRCRPDGHYGLGGVTAESRGGSRTVFELPVDRRVSRAELWYLAQPRGGELSFSFAEERVVLDTASSSLEDRWHVLEGRGSEIEVRASGGRVRAYGLVLENEGPGVVWDGLPMVGAFTRRLLALDEAHFTRQVARRNPDLVVLNYGGNDLRRIVSGAADRALLEEETDQVLARVRAAVPDAACLVVGINDHTASGPEVVAPRHVARVIAAQRAAAQRAGCGFWDQLAAMGGPGSFRAWRVRGLASSDGKHLTEAGRAVIAARMYAALMHARRQAGAI